MTDEQLEDLKHWAKGRWPVPAAKVEQLFAVMESAIQEARDQALEDAARHIGEHIFSCASRSTYKSASVPFRQISVIDVQEVFDIQAAIRAMKGKSE